MSNKRAFTAQEITIIGIFAGLTAILAQIAIPLPFKPIHFSFGKVAVYLTGILLNPLHAFLTKVCY